MQFYLETPRLILRDLLPSDEEGMFALNADQEVMRYVGAKPLNDIEQAREAIAFIRRQYETNGIGRWAVIEKDSGSFVGWAGLKLMQEPVNGYVDFYDIGYRFMKSSWGKGYATEAASATLQYAWEVMRLPEVNAMANVDNVASRRVLTKIGLQENGLFEYDGDPHVWFEMGNPTLLSPRL
ncbi:GNAT family N-acetyltransferase [Polluticoccus soli]|uniref:GNAT family N-acetyltransferase n=1 Tax=Polluticoccus soli TaxID=3034150 RepID=UPI0023E1119E|nr:GNAT family N-acetyltransferase [Flavipsychrobacter sp. JY13-12]